MNLCVSILLDHQFAPDARGTCWRGSNPRRGSASDLPIEFLTEVKVGRSSGD